MRINLRLAFLCSLQYKSDLLTFHASTDYKDIISGFCLPAISTLNRFK